MRKVVYETTISHGDTIVLSPCLKKVSHYSGADRKGFRDNIMFFKLDDQGPFPVIHRKRLEVIRDDDGVFDSFEWVDLEQ